MAVAIGKVEKYINESIDKKGALLFSLVDPLDYKSLKDAAACAKGACEAGTDLILIGGSTGVQGDLLDAVAKEIKSFANVPVVLFPGNISTVSRHADAVYFMSMLNSRNPYWISTAQMLAAHNVLGMKLEPLPVGYVVVEPGGTVGFVGDANLIPRNKPKLAAAYALAGQYIGHRLIITDAGSNPATGHIPLEMVQAVSKSINVPYIVAGGIRTPQQAKAVVGAGAQAIQVGTAYEGGKDAAKVTQLLLGAVREGARQRLGH
ncbi:geranylgeranylglyceryl/heptaprenylglyceryl phosphate synthase [Candidatus Parvarchaeota archaeon]|nr:geranylgeranylglyceryl/heptaprenylglyceryl phosphate synthase [Candidatus Parvarchaeota archaeon]